MCWAFPYDEVINGIHKGYAEQAVGPVPSTIRGFDPGTFRYTTDLAKAKALFAKAGVAEGTQLSLIQSSNVELAVQAAQAYQASLAQVGITLKIDAVDYSAFAAAFYGDQAVEERPNLFWWGWWPDYNDAWNHLYPQVSSEAWGSKGANAGFYKNARVDELLGQAKGATDPRAYQAAMSEIQQILSRDDPPAVYYAHTKWSSVLRKDIQGFVFNPIYLGTYDFYRMSRASS
jgi:peptide/nickel transport system substrate-binding protein